MSITSDLRDHWHKLVDAFEPPPGGAPLPKDYVTLAATKKLGLLAEQLAIPYDTLPTVPEGDPTGLVDKGLLQKTFSHAGDELPELTPGHLRPKYIHCFGVAGVLSFQPAGSSFTGLLSKPVDVVGRLSNGQNPRSPDKSFVPGVALKFLVDGKPSRNILFGGSPDGQETSAFFQQSLASFIGCPSNWQLVVLNAAFEQAVGDPTFNRGVPQGARELPCLQLCDVEANGTPVTAVKAPLALQLVPSAGIADWWTGQEQGKTPAPDFRDTFAQIAPGTTLYDVMDVAPKWPAPGEEGKGPQTPQKVGELVTKSKLVASSFADRRLFFEHPMRTVDVGTFPSCPAGGASG